MAYDDKLFGNLLPTRNGTALGAGGERQMLDAIDGAQGFRTRLQNNPDGSVTRLKTRNGMPEFVTTPVGYGGNGGSEEVRIVCNFEIESGMVDLKAGGEFDPNLEIDATLHSTGYVPLANEGRIAKSFYQRPDKKVVAWHVPSSMFTGRTKFYVQSLYGGLSKRVILNIGDGPRPFLMVTTRQRQDRLIPAIPITTSTGVFFDEKNCMHWLINPAGNEAYCYRLLADVCGELLRKQIKKNYATYTPEQRDRSEAMLLSYCIPEEAPSQIVHYSDTPESSMGYGWHWNWDGDRCDLVDVREIYVTGVGAHNAYGFESTHYRLQFALSDAGVFSVLRTIESGPSKWSVPKNINVIAYPDWEEGKLVKAGNLPSGIDDVAMAGTVYAFYARNDLKIITYAGSPQTQAAYRESSPEYFGGLYWTTTPTGLLNAFETGNTIGGGASTGMSHTFTCDAVSVGGLNMASDGNEASATWLGRTELGVVGTAQVTGSPLPLLTGIPSLSVAIWAADGRPGQVDAVWSASETVGVGRYYKVQNVKESYSFHTKSYQDIKGAFSLIVIPMMDAQAVYMYGEKVHRKLGAQRTGTNYQYAVDDRCFRYETAPDVWTGYFNKYYPYEVFNGAMSSDDTVDSPLDETTVSYQPATLICSSGSFPATPSDVAVFFTPLGAVEQSWGTITSINGVVISQSNNIYTGSTVYPSYPSLIGWS